MSHLHIPDGILPPLLWVCGLILTVLLLGLSGLGAGKRAEAGLKQVAFQSSLGGIMLAVMAIPVPITAFDYCMTLAGPVGVLLGARAAFQVSFVVTLMLALLGQGGFTVIGLNTLVLALGAVLARPLYLGLVRSLGPARSMAAATAVSQLVSTLCWTGLLLLSVRLTPQVAGDHEVAHSLVRVWQKLGAGLLVPMLLAAVALEALLGYGLAHFLHRVRPELLPVPVGAVAPDRNPSASVSS